MQRDDRRKGNSLSESAPSQAKSVRARIWIAAGTIVAIALVGYGLIRTPVPGASTPDPASEDRRSEADPGPRTEAPPTGAASRSRERERPARVASPRQPGEQRARAERTNKSAMRENSEASDPEMSPQAVLDEALARLEASRGRASRLAALEQLAEVVNDRDWTEPSSEASLPDVIEPLREAATDSDPEVAEAAIEALEPIGTTDSAGALGDVLASNASEDTKLLAIDAILTYDGPGSAQALARGLADPNTTIREEVAWALGWTYDRDRSALAALVQAERAEPDESIRDTMDQSIEDIEWDLN